MADTEYRTTASELTSIADAIRTKGGTSSSLVYPNGFVSAIGNIQTGGVLQTKTVTPSTNAQTVAPDSGYDGLSSVIVSAMPSGSARVQNMTITADPVISVSTGGVVTATVSASQAVTPTVSAGYVSVGTAGTVTVGGDAMQQLTTQAAQTITPTTTDQTIASGKYLTGAQTILGDANLLAENIKKDVSIFGVTGTLEGGSATKTINIFLQQPLSSGAFVSFTIHECEIVNGVPVQGQTIGNITSPTGSTTISTNSNYIRCNMIGDYVSPPTGMYQFLTQGYIGVVRVYDGGTAYIDFCISGDASVTIYGIDWSD